MHYDVVIIGAGMSGLAAGIRLAYFDKQVCIVEKHYAYGGLNSYYKIDGREFDVGLHAVTNYVPPGVRHTPLPKLLRQLRLTPADFDLRPQHHSEIRFPDRHLRFTNDIDVLVGEVARQFPREVDRFRQLIARIRDYDDTRLDAPYASTRAALSDSIHDPVLIEMLLCPIMYYGSAQPHDMDFMQFVIMFKSLFCEGFGRPPGGVRTIIKALVKKYRACGGKIRMRCGVDRLEIRDGRVEGVTLESGETLTADVVLSSAGFTETMRLCSDGPGAEPDEPGGRLSFVELIAVLDRPAHELGHDATIIFFNDSDRFTYAVPDAPVDYRSGVFCCPHNYEGHEGRTEGVLRVTWLADHGRWSNYDDDTYAAGKRELPERFIDRATQYVPGIRDRIMYTDAFTPRTIQRYTGHLGGAVYGAPHKRRDGRTRLSNLYICGTDQGYLGIVGAMLSGITMANMHVLSKD